MEIQTLICEECKKPFTCNFVWFLTKRKRCDKCYLSNPRIYKFKIK